MGLSSPVYPLFYALEPRPYVILQIVKTLINQDLEVGQSAVLVDESNHQGKANQERRSPLVSPCPRCWVLAEKVVFLLIRDVCESHLH
jgi:hypothetical protein